jgi:hypothetical protein
MNGQTIIEFENLNDISNTNIVWCFLKLFSFENILK